MIPLKDDVPSRTFPTVTLLLIALNVVVFLLQNVLGPRFTYAFSMVPARVSHHPTWTIGATGFPAWATIFSSMFMHGSIVHLGGNMLYLWIFGNNTEDTLGHVRFLLFYLACGVAAAGLFLLMGPDASVPTLGASGAIAGVLGAYLYLFPWARVTTVIFIVFFWTVTEISAKVLLGFWFIMQVYYTLISEVATLGRSQQSGGVAFGAHVGGFIAGWLLIRMLARRSEERPRYTPPPRFFDEHWR